MELNSQIIISLIGLLGVGGILGTYFQSIFQQKSQIKEREHELKRIRYGSILIFMLTKLDSKNGLSHLKNIRPDMKTKSDLDKELQVECLNAIFFANDDVIKSLANFIHQPTYDSYYIAVIAMRKDLWGTKTSLGKEELNIFTRTYKK